MTRNLLFIPMAPRSAPAPPNSTLCVPPIGVLPTVYCSGLPARVRQNFNANQHIDSVNEYFKDVHHLHAKRQQGAAVGFQNAEIFKQMIHITVIIHM